MWTPDRDQASRARRIAEVLHPEVPALWNFQAHFHDDIGQRLYSPAIEDSELDTPPLSDYYAATMTRLREAIGDETLDRALLDYLFFPAETRAFVNYEALPLATHMIGVRVARTWFVRQPGDYGCALLQNRIRYILGHVFEGAERPVRPEQYDYAYLAPDFKGCVAMVRDLRSHPPLLEFIDDLVSGRFDTPITPPPDPDFGRMWHGRWACHGAEVVNSYRAYGSDLSVHLDDLLSTLERAGRLDYEKFRASVLRLPVGFPQGVGEVHHPDRGSPATWKMARRLAWESVQQLTPETFRLCERFRYTDPVGARWLVKGCEHIQALGLKVITAADFKEPAPTLRFLLGIAELEPDDREDAIVERLREFSPGTLTTALPHAGAGQGFLLKALEWQCAEALLALIKRLGGRRFLAAHGMRQPDFPNCSDPSCGVVDRDGIGRVVSCVPEGIAKKLIKSLSAAHVELDHTCTVVAAVMGWNRDAIVKHASRDGQIGLKAFGLLPLDRGEKEVLERYLTLRNAEKDASCYGPERLANTRAAVEAGLTNLARNAGFVDSTRLEWAMEATVSRDLTPIGKPVTVAEYELELVLDGVSPGVLIRKKGRTLASVPAALKKSPEYERLRNGVAQLKAQVTRFRESFEDAMVFGDWFTERDVRNINALPLARTLLERLILRASDGTFAVYDRERGEPIGIDGRIISLAGPVQIAHVQQLFTGGVLADWQREVVRRRLVQPFKQAFRELYILTPAEIETRTFSNRFAGHALAPKVASRLFQARGWQIEGGDIVTPVKHFWRAGLCAAFLLPDARHFLGGDDPVVTDCIVFSRDDGSTGDDDAGVDGHVPLCDVPPLIFSEVMRDADLVVSVAQIAEDKPAWSDESYARRAELVTTLVEEIGLAGVTREGHFVRVTGKIARYRVHLGSGAVHIEPGNYLCIVPVPQADRSDKTIFLPFADADRKTSEIISKIFLLANDDRIKDDAILRQIRAATSR